MENYEVIILCAINLISFAVGAKIGQGSIRGREITFNPVKAIKNDLKENKINKKEDLRRRKIETALENKEKNNGTALAQKEIPKDYEVEKKKKKK